MLINACKTTNIYCRPDCPPGRRTKPENRVQFDSFEAAVVSGSQACKICRPEVGAYGPWVAKAAPGREIGDSDGDSTLAV